MNKKILGAGATPAAGSSSFNKRKSLKSTPNVPEDIPLNDDEAEIQQRRRISGKFGQLAGKRVSLGGIAELSASELVAQYTNCMRLSAENKINHKNAFSLPLIDCMKLLLKKKDEQMNNFQIVGCTLDASAKIYASRVDRVHMDGISFAKGLGSRARDLPSSKNSGSGEDEGLEENAEHTKKKKYKKKHKLSKDTAKINISMDAAEPDPTYVVLSKQFSNCQPSFISFIPRLSVVGDGSKVFMEMKRQFLTKEEETSSYKEMDVNFSCDVDGNGQIVVPPFREILARDSEDIDYDTLLHASTFDDSLLEIDDAADNDLNDFCGPEDPFLNADDAAMEKAAEDPREASVWNTVSSEVSEDVQAVGCQARNGPRERVVDLQQAILRKVQEGSNLEYTYMNLDRILFAGPAHWGRLPVVRVSAKEKTCALEGNKKREKKVIILDFNHVKDVDLPLSRGGTLTRTYIENNWSVDKVTNPADLHLDPKTLTRYFNCPKCGVSVTSTQRNGDILPEEEEDGDINDYDYDNLNDSQQFCPPPFLEPQSDGETSALKGNCPEGGEPAADVHSFEQPESSDGWSMVDPPNKVARIAVPYAQHAKKVDMKVLKTAIWSVLSGGKQNGEIDAWLTPRQRKRQNNNNIKNTNLQTSLMTGPMNFSDMEKRVMKIVPADMAQELTMPLIFTAVLHLANERILSLKGLEDHSDIIITQDSGAETFIRRLQQREFM